MTKDKVLQVIQTYRKHFESLNIPKVDFPHNKLVGTKEDLLAHCHSMLNKMEQFIVEERMDKVFRWLGFIQGCLWSTNQFTLEELRNHGRQDLTE